MCSNQRTINKLPLGLILFTGQIKFRWFGPLFDSKDKICKCIGLLFQKFKSEQRAAYCPLRYEDNVPQVDLILGDIAFNYYVNIIASFGRNKKKIDRKGEHLKLWILSQAHRVASHSILLCPVKLNLTAFFFRWKATLGYLQAVL